MSRRSNLKIKARKAEADRIIAIADYFLSSVDEASFEFRAVNHTTHFYCHLNNLVKRGYLRTFEMRRDGSNTLNYMSIVDYSVVEEIAESLDIHLYEYLYRGSV